MKRLWLLFIAVVASSFLVLGWIGTRIYQEAPPIADKVVTTDGRDRRRRRRHLSRAERLAIAWAAWNSGPFGDTAVTSPPTGRPTGSIAKRSSFSIAGRTRSSKRTFEELDQEQQAQLSGRLATLLRTNTYDPATRDDHDRSAASRGVRGQSAHYSDVFTTGRRRLRHSRRAP